MSPLNVGSTDPDTYHRVPPSDDNHHHHPSSADEPPEETVALSEDSTSSDSEVAVVVPPDGGWGWVIVGASFMCNMIVDGIIFSFAMFLTDIAAEFSVTKAQVTLVGSLMSGFYLIAGPFASAIANRYGFRPVAVLGSLVGASAFALSYFATSVQFLCISYGVLGGIGFGFIYVPAVIAVGFYFERWRALATGIAVCGSGIGTFAFAPLGEALVASLGWRSALLAQAAVVLCCLFFGLLFRPLKPTMVKKIQNYDDDLKSNLEVHSANTTKESQITSLGSLPHLLGIVNNSDYNKVSEISRNKNEKRLSVPFVAELEKPLKDGKGYLLLGSSPILFYNKAEKDRDEVMRPMYRDDIFFGASLNRLPQYTSTTSVAYNISVTKPPTKNDVQEERKHKCLLLPEAFKRSLSTMLDMSLLKSPSFLILAFGGFLTMMGFYVPFMFLSVRAVESGMNKTWAVWLVSSIGIANTVGRVLCGVLSSFPGVNALFVTNAALTIGGIATIFSGLSMSAEYQFFYTLVFGLSMSCFASLRSIIVVDLLGLDKLTNAFGLLLLCQGVSATIGAPLAGAFMDATGSYDATFYLSGGVLLASAVICYPLNFINKWERRRAERQALEQAA